MMLDDDIVAVSPSSTYRVLKAAGRLDRRILDEDRGGVGLELTIHTESGEVVVSKVIDGSPVSKTRLVSQGDKLLSIDLLGQSFEVSNSLSRAIGLLRGKPGTKVSFEMVNQNGERSKITLKRELLVRKDESNGRPTRH
jgi:C-terminal processing protease CtpA/Prc